MGVVSLGWEALQWEGRKLRPDQKMGQFQSQSAQSRLGWAVQWVALEPVQLQVALSFAFPFPRLPSGKPPRLLGSSGIQLPPAPVLPLAMKIGGILPQLKHKWALTARRAVVITGSPLQSPLPEKVPPPKLGALPREKIRECETE